MHIRYFESYAHHDAELVGRFRRYLRPLLAAAKGYTFEGWSDQDLMLGLRWHDEIQAALGSCELGLIYLSPAFLASEYISQHELPKLLANHRWLVPVELCPVNFRFHDLKGLKERQFFRFNGQSFRDCDHPERFVDALFTKWMELIHGK